MPNTLNAIALPQDASPPTAPGWPSRSSRTISLAGPRASVWANRQQPPRPSGDASSPWPDASPARPAASLCICHRAGPGKTSSAALSPNCAPCPFHPDAIHGVRPLHRITHRLADLRQAGPLTPSASGRRSKSLPASLPRAVNLPRALMRARFWGFHGCTGWAGLD